MPQDTPTHACPGVSSNGWPWRERSPSSPRSCCSTSPPRCSTPSTQRRSGAAVDEVAEARGLTTVVVEHRLGPWLDLVDRLVVLDATGRVVADGEPARGARPARGVPCRPGHLGARVPRSATTRHTCWGVRAVVDGRQRARPSTRQTSRSEGRCGRSTARPAPRSRCRTSGSRPAPGRCTRWSGPSGSGKSTFLLALAGLLRLGRAGQVAAAARPARSTGSATHASWARSTWPAGVAWVPQWASSTIVSPDRARRGDDHVAGRGAGRVRGAGAGPGSAGAPRVWPTWSRPTPDTSPVGSSVGWRWRPQWSTSQPWSCSPTRPPSARTGSPGPPSWASSRALRDAGAADRADHARRRRDARGRRGHGDRAARSAATGTGPPSPAGGPVRARCRCWLARASRSLRASSRRGGPPACWSCPCRSCSR